LRGSHDCACSYGRNRCLHSFHCQAGLRRSSQRGARCTGSRVTCRILHHYLDACTYNGVLYMQRDCVTRGGVGRPGNPVETDNTTNCDSLDTSVGAAEPASCTHDAVSNYSGQQNCTSVGRCNNMFMQECCSEILLKRADSRLVHRYLCLSNTQVIPPHKDMQTNVKTPVTPYSSVSQIKITSLATQNHSGKSAAPDIAAQLNNLPETLLLQ
jgi:hypothetical protein